MDKTKKISVIIPVFNAEDFLEDALRSIFEQNYQNMEIIVVDDGSTDDTDVLLQKYGEEIHCIRQENRGPSAARNRGLQISTGELIAFLDADDEWSKTKIKLQLSQMKSDDSLEIVVGKLRRFWTEKKLDRTERHYIDEGTKVLHLGASLFKREAFEKIGLFDENLLHGEDWDWFIRAKDSGLKIGMFPDVVMYQCLHQNNLTRNREEGNQNILKMLKKNIDRRIENGDGAVESFKEFERKCSED